MFEAVLRAGSPAQTAAHAAALAPLLEPPLLAFLSGDLGAGKTHWARALLRALGETGPAPSPSFALALSYDIGGRRAHHLDCFRLQGAPLGDDLAELLDDDAFCLVEWPERATGLPRPDLRLRFCFADGEGDSVRRIHCAAREGAAAAALRRLEAAR